MTLVRVKRVRQVTLPAELRKQFHLDEGDYLEVDVVEKGILFRLVSVVDRQQAWQQLRGGRAVGSRSPSAWRKLAWMSNPLR